MNIGKHRTRVILQQPTRSLGTSGSPVEVWSNYGSRWARDEELGGGESNDAQKVESRPSHRLSLRYDRTIHSSMRVLMIQAATTLGAELLAAATTATIAAYDKFPQSGEAWLACESEVLQVTSGLGSTTLTVKRGEQKTAAATHANGTALYHVRILEIEAALNTDGKDAESILICRERG